MLVYTFTLFYKPTKTDRTPIVRSQSTTIGVECHYHM